MPDTRDVAIRSARRADATWIAQLHADSWRRNYRGAYADRYLDGDLVRERTEVWIDRLSRSGDDTLTLIAEYDDRAVGFLHAELDSDPIWGVLIDNLHVLHQVRRTGVGTKLMSVLAAMVASRRPGSAIYLWVQEQNDAARAFYLALGGTIRDRELVSPPRGDPENLVGSPVKLRIAWSSPSALVDRSYPLAPAE